MTNKYIITRLQPQEEYLGTYTNFASIKYDIDEYGEQDNTLSDWPPKVNESVAVSGNMNICDNCNTNWITTKITDIINLTYNECTFNTKNSKYKIEVS